CQGRLLEGAAKSMCGEAGAEEVRLGVGGLGEQHNSTGDLIKYVYAFGDSYSFIQGVSGYPNYSFIGDALHPSFTPEELLSNEIIPRNLEFLTGCFQGLPSHCEKQLWDFAFAGADIDVALLPRHHNFTIQLVEQVDQWVR
ncbi:hypothetical protein MPER_03790, partial [Moniliophthora perniciosa FA553]